MIDVKNKKVALHNQITNLDNLDITPTGIMFLEDRSFINEKIKQNELERQQKDKERKETIEKLRRVNVQSLENNQKQNDEDFIKNLQTKIMLVSKHPEIRDPSRKIKLSKWKFKYTSLKDVIPPEEEKEKMPKTKGIWDRLWSEGDSRPFEKRWKYHQIEDISIPINENMADNEVNIENNSDDDLDYVSRNKVLQDKYNENFHSNIISTGTVSIVINNKKEKIIDRTKFFTNHEYYEEDGSSSLSQFSDDKFISKGKTSSVEQCKEESKEKISQMQISKLVAKAFSNKIKNSSSEGQNTPSPIINSPFSLKNRSTSAGLKNDGKRSSGSDLRNKSLKKNATISSKFRPKRLQRRGTFLFDK
jgi:hypothetical protein